MSGTGLFMRSVKNESQKLLSRKKYIVFLIIEIAICLLTVLIQTAVRRATGEEITIRFVNLSLAMLTFFLYVYIPLIIFMASCDLFSTEAQNNTVKAVLMRPISRFKIFLSKALTVAIVAVVYLVILFLITVALEAFTSGKVANFWVSIGAYLLDIIPLICVVLMAVFINQVTRSSSLAMFLCILIYIALCLLGIAVPMASGLIFTGYLQWHNVWLGATIPFGAMMSKIGLLAGYCLLLGGGGFYLFDRREY